MTRSRNEPGANLRRLVENQMVPAKTVAFERRKVAVASNPGASFRDRERGVLRVCDELARRSGRATESSHVFEMRRGRQCDPTPRMGRELLDDGEGDRKRGRVPVAPRVWPDPNE